MKRPEQALQIAVAQWLSVCRAPGMTWFAVPNGGARSKVEGAILKGMGVRAGIPDLCIVCRGRAFFIELKAPGGRLSPAQTERMAELELSGAAVAVCSSLEEVAAALDNWGIKAGRIAA